ncbi:Glycosyl transferase family 2 [Jannaschia faecimaris]|uniref:Glycosyl transferase family 2 n=1 Tax=Jannaschia faecimaris TaxID=1244108 RepID=A0A1H3UCM6_9RHOB|nr:glycosyltransferase [Jannaschia faecimaris]SDZ60128.1 Glycosyl transferase family 2 [Jannaschia faecimaris]
MRIAVVTPYYKETNEVLQRCHDSVLQQTIDCDHFLVSDGFPNTLAKEWAVKHFELSDAHGHGGNTPRVIGAISAFNQGYDAVAFLDADNWFKPDHLEKMVDLHCRTDAAVCTTGRSMHRADSSYMFDDDKNDGRTHVDTSCLFLTRSAKHVVAKWALLPPDLGGICDTIYWSSILSAGLTHAHLNTPTVCFYTSYEADYRRLGEPLPDDVKMLAATDAPFSWFKSLPIDDRWRMRSELGWPSNFRSVSALRLSYVLSRLKSLSSLRVFR